MRVEKAKGKEQTFNFARKCVCSAPKLLLGASKTATGGREGGRERERKEGISTGGRTSLKKGGLPHLDALNRGRNNSRKEKEMTGNDEDRRSMLT